MPNTNGGKKNSKKLKSLRFTIMLSDKSPVFRKAIIPWYHSKTVYGASIAFMLIVFLFGLAGISVSLENIQFNDYIWVPIVLVVLSGGIILFNFVRLIRRHASR